MIKLQKNWKINLVDCPTNWWSNGPQIDGFYKIVSIFDDWHFENKSDIIRERSELNLKLSKISEVVVSKAKAAAELIKVDYKVLKAVTSLSDTMKSEAIHDGIDKNLCYDWLLGDRQKGKDADDKADNIFGNSLNTISKTINEM